MISDAILEQRIARGILSSRQAADLRALAQDMAAAPVTEPDDGEKLRFITGFNDIFVTLGIGLFTVAVGYFVSLTAGQGAVGLALAPVSWALSEFFTRNRHMALPSIVLLCLFAGSVFMGTMALIVLSAYDRPAFKLLLTDRWIYPWKPSFVLMAALMMVAMVALHSRRFRVPITVAVGAAAVAVAVISVLVSTVPDLVKGSIDLVVLVIGLAVFALAMRFDLLDPARVTRRTDPAFWLHLLAAPMIVHPLISQFIGDLLPQLWMAAAVLAIFVVLGAIAVVIDRRAMLVSGLSYAGYAFASLFTRVGFTDHAFPATLLALGAFMLLLSAGWRPVRSILLRRLPPRFARHLPHPSAIS